MTYNKLQRILRVMLLGDNVLPEDPQDVLALLEMAYIDISNDCTALKILSTNGDDNIMRMGPGDLFVRMPRLPESGEDILDIDSELVPAVARVMASYISQEKVAMHLQIAKKVIMQYESKVRAYLLKEEQKSKYDFVETKYIQSTDDHGIVGVVNA